jgi:hypothetical protein
MGMKLVEAQMVSGVTTRGCVTDGEGGGEKVGLLDEDCVMEIAGSKELVGAAGSAAVTSEIPPGEVFPWVAQATQKSSNKDSKRYHLGISLL